ncbi:MAG: oxygen-independent coproporphyrinogen III oxidase [Hyphomicrobiaceae bacterium]
MNPDLVKSYSAPAPRYTSYPTAQQFGPAVQAAQYGHWLSQLSSGAKISIYCHIPYCQSLCWYCGCTTKALRRYDPITAYMEPLQAELANVAALVPVNHEVTHIHWGGGTPNILNADDITRLAGTIRRLYRVAADAEFAVEIDPRHLDSDQVTAFEYAGVNRISVGVQDFEPAVQAAINREQTFEMTERAITMFRDRGIRSINADLVYGLPHQSCDSVSRTIEQVLTLRPDRIATFGYAHLPSRLVHQRLIDSAVLPDAMERFAQSQLLAQSLTQAGYLRVGMDHFALPTDHLASKTLKRNFQGYSTEQADALLGFGASAIGQLPQGFVQNATATGEYIAKIGTAGLATVRGVALTDDDRARGSAIEQLMCQMEFSQSQLVARYGKAAAPVVKIANDLIAADTNGFVARTADGFAITQAGRPFVRTICTAFDRYFQPTGAVAAMAV